MPAAWRAFAFRYTCRRRPQYFSRLIFLGDVMRNFSMLALVLGLVACRDTSKGDDQQPPDGNSNDITIQEIQNPSMPACDPATPSTCVELKIKGVVVTAIDTYGGKTGD